MARPAKCLLTTIESDSHMWNLVYLQLFLEEQGFEVHNLGCCVPPEAVIDGIELFRPDLVLVSTVNGHGVTQGRTLIEFVRQKLGPSLPRFVIGGKLTVEEAGLDGVATNLRKAGYDGVFYGHRALDDFTGFLTQLSTPAFSRAMG